LIKNSPREPWFRDIRSWKEAYPFTYEKSAPNEAPKPQAVIEELTNR